MRFLTGGKAREPLSRFGEIPKPTVKSVGSQSLLIVFGNQWYISEQRSPGIGTILTISITGRDKSPSLGKPSTWSVLPKGLPRRIVLLWAR